MWIMMGKEVHLCEVTRDTLTDLSPLVLLVGIQPSTLESLVSLLVLSCYPLDDVITTRYYDDLYDPINTHLEKI